MLVLVPIVSANFTLNVSNNPPSADQQVQSGVQSAVSTEQNAVAPVTSAATQALSPVSQAAGAQPSPAPTSAPLSTAAPESLVDGVDQKSDASANTDTNNNVASNGPTSTSKTSNPAAKSSSSSALSRCVVCPPTGRAAASGLGSAIGDGGAAEEVDAAAMADAGQAPHVKDLTENQADEASPPAAVPGFGPAFALGGLAILVWVRRRAA